MRVYMCVCVCMCVQLEEQRNGEDVGEIGESGTSHLTSLSQSAVVYEKEEVRSTIHLILVNVGGSENKIWIEKLLLCSFVRKEVRIS